MRSLKPHHHLRTNQFEVTNQLVGLQERFRINDRDGLADALRDRLDLLQEKPSKFHPEILFLLLELSDQPTFRSKLSELDSLRPAQEEQDPPLRWEDIAQEDGWDEEIWRSNRYSDGSDDGVFAEDLETDSETTSLSTDDEAFGRTAEDFIITPEDTSLLAIVEQAQGWRVAALAHDPTGNLRKTAVNEMQIAREVLFMLQGLETTLFDNKGIPVPTFQMLNMEWDAYKAIINMFAESGRRLGLLRKFVHKPQTIPHLQALQDCISKRLLDFDSNICRIQARLAAPKDQVIVSLLAISGEISPWLEPLTVLANIIGKVQEKLSLDVFGYLEVLFDETNMARLTGDLVTYEYLARIFLEAFNVYLRPIRLWMDEGKLAPGNELFFIVESKDTVPLKNIWQDWFELRKTADGDLFAPRFLNPAANKICDAGKNVVVLKLLRKYETSDAGQIDEPPLDYDTVCPKGLELASFPDLFRAAFDRWIQSKYRKASSMLRDVLFSACGLSSALNSLRSLYLMSDGSAAALLSNRMFDKLDDMDCLWHDRFALTAAGHDAFASMAESNRLSICINREAQHIPVSEARSSVRTALPHIRIDYRLAWPVQLIVSDDCMAIYQSIFTLLLQLRRAYCVLHKHKVLDNYWTDYQQWDERALFYSARRNLLWFCGTIQTYLSTLVIAPNELKMRHDLQVAQDVDAMISVHAKCMKQIVDEACLGVKLAPIQEGILDILDLALKLEHTRSAKAEADAAALHYPSPLGDDGSDNEGDEEEVERRKKLEGSYIDVLRGIGADFNRHLRFICGGLRSVARATSDSQSAKWDILADMLQMGNRDEQ